MALNRYQSQLRSTFISRTIEDLKSSTTANCFALFMTIVDVVVGLFFSGKFDKAHTGIREHLLVEEEQTDS